MGRRETDGATLLKRFSEFKKRSTNNGTIGGMRYVEVRKTLQGLGSVVVVKTGVGAWRAWGWTFTGKLFSKLNDKQDGSVGAQSSTECVWSSSTVLSTDIGKIGEKI